jgi:hypothetical protein
VGCVALTSVRDESANVRLDLPIPRPRQLHGRRDRDPQIIGYTARERIIIENAAMNLRNAVRQGQNPASIIHAMSEAQGFRPSSHVRTNPGYSAPGANSKG